MSDLSEAREWLESFIDCDCDRCKPYNNQIKTFQSIIDELEKWEKYGDNCDIDKTARDTINELHKENIELKDTLTARDAVIHQLHKDIDELNIANSLSKQELDKLRKLPKKLRKWIEDKRKSTSLYPPVINVYVILDKLTELEKGE